MKTTYETLQEIEGVIHNYNVEITALQVDPSPYFELFGKQEELKHLIEIKQKSLADWKRKFNRELLKIKKY